MSQAVAPKNTKLACQLACVALAMFGFGYALVPLYDVFCDITGLNGKVTAVEAAPATYTVDPNRELTLELITAVNGAAPMVFTAETKKMKIHPGRYYRVNFYAENKTEQQMLARAIPSITPGAAASYLKKIECFCFVEQLFEPKQGKTMPVHFVVDPDLPEKYKTITLAYTFFDNTKIADNQQEVAYVHQ